MGLIDCTGKTFGYIVFINSLGGGHTNTHTDIHTKAILRNQECAGLWPAHAWFKNYPLL